MSDPIGQRAEPIMAHMNKDHTDSMVAIVCHRVPSLQRMPASVRMTAIDAKGYTLHYTVVKDLFANPKGDKHVLRVPFEPAVTNAAEVRGRLVEMSKEAMNKRQRNFPIIYSMPRGLLVWIVIHAVLIAAGKPGTASLYLGKVGLPDVGRTVDANLGAIVSRLGGASTAWLLYKFLAGAHIAEAVAMTAYCFQRGASAATTAKWVATHFFVGFPNYFAFLKVNPKVPAPKKH